MSNYTINYWGSLPENDNDDCWRGEDYNNIEEALADYNNPEWESSDYCVVIDGPDIHRIKLNPGFKPSANEDDDWRREQQMQSAMGFGVQGWNDWEPVNEDHDNFSDDHPDTLKEFE